MQRIDYEYPLYYLDDLTFPDPCENFYDGLGAISSDLEPNRLIAGYSNGFFPWFEQNGMFYWFCIDQRMILYTNEVKKSKNLLKKLRSKNWNFTINQHFTQVMHNCATIKRKHEDSTWITQEFIEAYTTLHQNKFAISVESYYKGELVGGLYGVAIGKYFSGESMFAKKSDASKLALIFLCDLLYQNGIEWIDCQSGSEHLLRMGAKYIPKCEFIEKLREYTT
ncbi:MAG: leucyl/phenylalanyl-tRNA--protein transferase [Epsilonproteobacteria bacterium]|nr:leucyl/phenylalanyl-tRNA--protein transferase [Campylobacterota bacterium]